MSTGSLNRLLALDRPPAACIRRRSMRAKQGASNPGEAVFPPLQTPRAFIMKAILMGPRR